MTNLNKLKALALEAVKEENYNDQPFFKPSEVLSLIEEVEAYRACLYHIAHTMDHETEDEQDLAGEVLNKFGGRDEK